MACTVAVTDVTGSGPVSSPTVTVTGTASECAAVLVRLTCSGAPMTTTAAVTGGIWTATFNNTDCACAGSLTVEVSCVTDPLCTTTFTSVLDCETCPTATVTVTVGGCNDLGERGVTFAVTVTGTPGTFLTQIEYIAGSGSASLARLDASYTETHFYPTGTAYTARLIIAFPLGCPSIDVPVPFLEACAPLCPTVDMLSTAAGGCLTSGARLVTLSASLGGFGMVSFRIVWGDGSPNFEDTQTLPYSFGRDHEYAPPGPYTARLEITSPTGCPASEITIGPLAACPVIGEPMPIPPDGGGDGGDGSADGGESPIDACMVSRWLIVFLLGAGTFFFLAWSCKDPGNLTSPLLIASGIFYGLGAIAMFLWAFLCEPSACEWLLLGWQVALAATFVAVYLAGCCPWLWWLALGFAVATAAAYAAWEASCSKFRCQREIELAAALLIISTTGLSWILGFIRCGWTDLSAAVAGTLGFYFVKKSWDCLTINPPGPDPGTVMPPPRVVRPPTRVPPRVLGRRVARPRRKDCGCK